ncbi:spore germination protein [Evansella clarkii]|uniref:spore germination protein n=1 Tax=Evansella clarkii TaxID=79879 RepID=UPI00099746B6|nr:spore germination protein [Evansella clarkii]
MGLFRKRKRQGGKIQEKQAVEQEGDSLSSQLDGNIKKIKELTGNTDDVMYRSVTIRGNYRLLLVYIEGISEVDRINTVINTLLQSNENEDLPVLNENENLINSLEERLLAISRCSYVENTDDLLTELLSGNTVIIADGFTRAISCNTPGGKRRAVEEPSTETVIRGPKDGFTEDIRTNISLIRDRIKTPDLWYKIKKVGKQTQTDVAVMYINNIADRRLVKEVVERLESIETDSILESNYIEEFIQDETYTLFPQIQNKERPDAVAAALLEGRVAIIVNGTPFALIAPVTLAMLMQTAEDYYQRPLFVTFLRLLRTFSFFVAMLLPGVYIAITTHHQEMLPTVLLFSLAAQREGVPFPAIVEALLMEVTFEILREAGVRMPKAIGASISIVGALVLGQAAVEAGVVSAVMVIIVSFTAITNFIIPTYNLSVAVRLLRFAFMILSAAFGFLGILAGLLILLIHLAGLRSFGVPYLTPMAPFILSEQKDTFFRFPLWALNARPESLNPENKRRMSANMKPSPPKKESS